MAVALNPLAVLVAAVAAFFIGFLWHGPLFGKQWMKLSGISEAEVAAQKAKGMQGMGGRMFGALVQQIVTAAALAILSFNLKLSTGADALHLALLVWLGFIATTLLNGVLWEKRSMPLYTFNIVYHLVSLITMALIVVMWA